MLERRASCIAKGIVVGKIMAAVLESRKALNGERKGAEMRLKKGHGERCTFS
jgi:hypothetical protein